MMLCATVLLRLLTRLSSARAVLCVIVRIQYVTSDLKLELQNVVSLAGLDCGSHHISEFRDLTLGIDLASLGLLSFEVIASKNFTCLLVL